MAQSDEKMFDSVPSWLMRYRAGQVVFGEGDPSNLMYRVESGCVRLQVNGSEGVRQIVSFLFNGELFGYSANDRKISAEATSATVLRCWSIRSMLSFGARSQYVATALINLADAHVAEIAHHLEKFTHLSATDRVRWFLTRLRDRDGLRGGDGRLELPMTRRDIADHLSLSAETLSRAIHELEDEGFLQRAGHRGVRLRGQQLQTEVPEARQLSPSGNPDDT